MNVLGIFVKQPAPGRVKTRLAADLGDESAADLYAAFMTDIVDRFRETADRRWLCHAPSDEFTVQFFSKLAADCYELWRQPERSLGERLDQFFRDAFHAGASRIVVIGSDSPTLPSFLVDQAFEQLFDHDCVLGPATDGGYYLIGQSGKPRALFDDVDWSQPAVLEQTIELARRAEARAGLLMPWYDVDTLDDLQLLRGHIAAMRAAGHPVDVGLTESCLKRLVFD